VDIVTVDMDRFTAGVFSLHDDNIHMLESHSRERSVVGKSQFAYQGGEPALAVPNSFGVRRSANRIFTCGRGQGCQSEESINQLHTVITEN
jgi:hypothetical protein